MAESVKRIQDLSKRYLIGHQFERREKYSLLRDALSREARNFAKRAVKLVLGHPVVQGDEFEEFWALKNINLTVNAGEVLGVIGRNGTGKSTLLKVLSRITEPSAGRVTIQGRVASLLEVGTGFHPELTGRENIFLNGAILGMTQREIRKKLDEIVAFAEVDRFLDTPVKRYSSGMYVRLAFAVAAHLEPEILIIDEVLAVGDAKFQQKCLGKMKDVATDGRTVIFVSHNMSAISQLTTRCVVLNAGQVSYVGDPQEAIAQYANDGHSIHTVEFHVENVRREYDTTGDVRILSFKFDRPLSIFKFAEPIRFSVSMRAQRSVSKLRVSMTIFASDGTPVGSSFSAERTGLNHNELKDISVVLNTPRLAPGSYYCGVSVGSGSHRNRHIDYDIVTNTLNFEVAPEETKTGEISTWTKGWGSISFQDLILEAG